MAITKKYDMEPASSGPWSLKKSVTLLNIIFICGAEEDNCLNITGPLNYSS